MRVRAWKCRGVVIKKHMYYLVSVRSLVYEKKKKVQHMSLLHYRATTEGHGTEAQAYSRADGAKLRAAPFCAFGYAPGIAVDTDLEFFLTSAKSQSGPRPESPKGALDTTPKRTSWFAQKRNCCGKNRSHETLHSLILTKPRSHY